MTKTKIVALAACILSLNAMTAFASSQTQEATATQCKYYLTHYASLKNMPAAVGGKAAPALIACYNQYSCTQTMVLSTVQQCQDRLDAWYAYYTAPRISSEKALVRPEQKSHPSHAATAPKPAPVMPRAQKHAIAKPVAPAIQPAAIAPTQPVKTAPTSAPKPKKSSSEQINWF